MDLGDTEALESPAIRKYGRIVRQRRQTRNSGERTARERRFEEPAPSKHGATCLVIHPFVFHALKISVASATAKPIKPDRSNQQRQECAKVVRFW
jgi:hypothetical protein